MLTQRSVDWHVGHWGVLGWLETAIKSLAFVVAYAALAATISSGWSAPRGACIAELALIGLATLGLVAAIGDRVIERELIAMVFVLFNNLAHLSMLASLLTDDGPGSLLTVFALLMLGGELVKVLFLRSTGFTVRDAPASVVLGLTSAYAVLYLLAALVWVVWG